MKISEYRVIKDDRESGLEKDVNTAIKNGWEPIGGASVAVDSNFGRAIFCQAMVKRDSEGAR